MYTLPYFWTKLRTPYLRVWMNAPRPHPPYLKVWIRDW